MFKILVLEDDVQLLRTVCSYLNQNGYSTVGCKNADEAYDAMDGAIFDMIISDIMMPGTNGFDFAESVRQTNREIPILFMSAREDIQAKTRGFSIGIDDYMVKPFELDELVLRVGALLRRAKIIASKRLTVGGLVLDTEEHSATHNGKDIPLTVREFNIIYKLLSYSKKTFTRTSLMDEFWSYDTTSSPRAVDVYMTKLREKFSGCDEFEIQTVHGLGYKAVIK